MTSTDYLNISVGIAVVALLVVRQMQARRVKETSALRLVVVLGVIGLLEVKDAIGSHPIAAGTIALLIGSLLIGGALGALRAMTVVIWRSEDGSAWRKGTTVTALLWLVSLGAHFAMEAGIEASTKITALGSSSILLYVALTLGVQREVVRWRAARLASARLI